MTSSYDEPPENELDSATKSCLEEAFRTPGFPQGILALIRERAQQEWRAVNAEARRMRRWRLAGLAASVLLAAVGLSAWWHAPAVRAEFGQVVRADAGGLEDRSGLFGRPLLGVSAKLYVGQTIKARGPALIVVGDGGSIRVASGSLFELRDQRTVQLRYGQMYVEFPPGVAGAAGLVVATSAGTVEHLGTQFEVATLDRNIRVRVREGQVRFVGATVPVIAGAGTELDIGSSGGVARKVIETHGRDWAWAESLAPDFVLDGRHLVDFLHWVARETGRQIDFADERARQVAESTVLHGSVRGMTPLEALTSVVSTTSLRFQLQDHSIRVVSGG